MGTAQFDPKALGRPAWNAGQKVGIKKPLKQRQIWAIWTAEGWLYVAAVIDLFSRRVVGGR